MSSFTPTIKPPTLEKASTCVYYKESFAKEILPVVVSLLANGEELFLPCSCSPSTLYQKANAAWKYLIDHGRNIEDLKTMDIPWDIVMTSRDKFKISVMNQGILISPKVESNAKATPVRPRQKIEKKENIKWEPILHSWLEQDSPKEPFSLPGLELSLEEIEKIEKLLTGLGNIKSVVTTTNIDAEEI